MVFDLMVQSSAEPVAPHAAAAPVAGAQHLLHRPVRVRRRHQPMLDVVHDEDVLQIVRADGQRDEDEQQRMRAG